jgi:hypothetical protein
MKKILIALTALLAVACGKDKTVEEYQREKLRENLALYENVAGSYTGLVVSKTDGAVIGAMEVLLEAKTIATNPNGGETAVGTPVLAGTVNFLDQFLTTLEAPNGFYDPSTGAYSAQIAVTRTDEVKETMNISGNIAGTALNGQLALASYSESGATLQLVKNGRPIAELLRDSGSRRPSEGRKTKKTYEGRATFNEKPYKRNVKLMVAFSTRSRIDDFLEHFAPANDRVVNVALDTGIIVVTLNKVKWDAQNGILEGSQDNSANGGYTQYIQCYDFYFYRQRESFSCRFWSSRSREILLEFKPPYQ